MEKIEITKKICAYTRHMTVTETAKGIVVDIKDEAPYFEGCNCYSKTFNYTKSFPTFASNYNRAVKFFRMG